MKSTSDEPAAESGEGDKNVTSARTTQPPPPLLQPLPGGGIRLPLFAPTSAAVAAASATAAGVHTAPSGVERQTTGPLRFRTRMCDTYALDGTCNFGARCAFAHSREDLRTVAQNEADGLTTDREVALFLNRLHNEQHSSSHAAPPPQQPPSSTNAPPVQPTLPTTVASPSYHPSSVGPVHLVAAAPPTPPLQQHGFLFGHQHHHHHHHAQPYHPHHYHYHYFPPHLAPGVGGYQHALFPVPPRNDHHHHGLMPPPVLVPATMHHQHHHHHHTYHHHHAYPAAVIGAAGGALQPPWVAASVVPPAHPQHAPHGVPGQAPHAASRH